MPRKEKISTLKFRTVLLTMTLVSLGVLCLVRSLFIWTIYDTQILILVFLPFTLTLGQYVIGVLGESRLIPSFTSAQWRAFMSGDLFLDLSMVCYAALLRGFVSKDVAEKVTNSFWHLAIIIVALTGGIFITLLEYKDNTYARRALLSPTKLYHNLIIIPVSTYLIGMLLIIMLYGGPGRWWLLIIPATIPMSLWAIILFLENKITSIKMSAHKRAHAHVSDWKVINVKRAKSLMADLTIWLLSPQRLE